MYLFTSKDRRKAKVFVFDGTGVCICMKRLCRGRLAELRRVGAELCMTIGELALWGAIRVAQDAPASSARLTTMRRSWALSRAAGDVPVTVDAPEHGPLTNAGELRRSISRRRRGRFPRGTSSCGSLGARYFANFPKQAVTPGASALSRPAEGLANG